MQAKRKSPAARTLKTEQLLVTPGKRLECKTVCVSPKRLLMVILTNDRVMLWSCRNLLKDIRFFATVGGGTAEQDESRTLVESEPLRTSKEERKFAR